VKTANKTSEIFTTVCVTVTQNHSIWTIVCDTPPVNGVDEAQVFISSHQDAAIKNARQ